MAGESAFTLHGTILVADDAPDYLLLMVQALQNEGHRVFEATGGAAALEILNRESIDAVVTDLQMPTVDGFEVLRTASAKMPPVPVVVVTGFGTVESAVEAMKLGALDFIAKPLDVTDLGTCVLKALEHRRMLIGAGSDASAEDSGLGELFGISPPMQDVFEQIRRVAPFKPTVLITGESGTGKELVARAVHALSAYRSGPFVALNCSALPRELAESQLFGHEKGAFTGAVTSSQGHFEAADGGTLFLDEIGDLPLEMQAKLLRVIEERQVVRVGNTQPVSVDVRLLAATNVDLKKAIETSKFREDLYHRLNVLKIILPSLRERRDDIALLVRIFLDRFTAEHNLEHREMPPDVLSRLTGYNWPGNVRELKNIIERVAITSHGREIQISDLPPEILEKESTVPSAGIGSLPIPGTSLEEIEQNVILHTLKHTKGNRTKSAKILGISVRTLQRKLNQYNLS
jgi:DNA-binding NtrC family response regulator